MSKLFGDLLSAFAEGAAEASEEMNRGRYPPGGYAGNRGAVDPYGPPQPSAPAMDPYGPPPVGPSPLSDPFGPRPGFDPYGPPPAHRPYPAARDPCGPSSRFGNPYSSPQTTDPFGPSARDPFGPPGSAPGVDPFGPPNNAPGVDPFGPPGSGPIGSAPRDPYGPNSNIGRDPFGPPGQGGAMDPYGPR